MKSRFFLLIAAAVLFASSASAANFSIYMNQEVTGNCVVGNLSGISANPDGNLVATTSGASFVNCGLQQGNGPSATLNIAPTNLMAGQTQATITWTANNVTSCNTTGTDGTVASAFSNAWSNSVVTCTGGLCTGGNNIVRATPISSASSGNYTFGIQCTNGGGSSGVFATSTVAVTGTSPGPSCTTGDQAADVTGYTCLGGGTILEHAGQGITIPNNPYTYVDVFGSAYPGNRTGEALSITLAKTQFLSIPFTATTGSAQFANSDTYSHYPVTFAISTQEGTFGTYDVQGISNDTTGKVICGQGGDPVLIASGSNQTVSCKLAPGSTYWLNMIYAVYNSSTHAWSSTCPNSSCPMSITLYPGG